MTPATTPDPAPRGLRRWVVYQRERFPLAAHAPLVLAFSFSAVSYAARLRGAPIPPWPNLLVAFATALCFFFQLRVADEHKDFEDDSRWRPYRAVPRGLVRLPELAALAALAAAIQLGLALWIAPTLVPLLLLAWAWLVLMTREFFAPRWLKAHPVVYLTSHMVILPLVDLYATACDWRVAGVPSPPGLGWFLAVSYANGIVLEIGRKLRAPEQEEEGVETYSALWGPAPAAAVWAGALLLTFACALGAAAAAHALVPVGVALTLPLFAAIGAAVRYARRPVAHRAKWAEPLAGVWTLWLYLTLGAVPRIFA